jgi:hypothetical protein
VSLGLSPKERTYESLALRRIFGPKREIGEECIMENFIICTLHHI